MIRLAEVFDELRGAFLEGQELALEKDAGFGCGRLQARAQAMKDCRKFTTFDRRGGVEPGFGLSFHDPGLDCPGHGFSGPGGNLIAVLIRGQQVLIDARCQRFPVLPVEKGDHFGS